MPSCEFTTWDPRSRCRATRKRTLHKYLRFFRSLGVVRWSVPGNHRVGSPILSVPFAIKASTAAAHCPRRCLLVEVDVLNEHDLAVVVFDDVVAVEPVAVLIEIVGALGADVALDAQDRLANLLRLNTLSVFDRER